MYFYIKFLLLEAKLLKFYNAYPLIPILGDLFHCVVVIIILG